MIFSIHSHNNIHTFVWYSPYISIMFTLHFHNIIMMIIPSFFHLCFPPSAFSYYQQPYSCRHFIVELFSGKWIHAIYLSRTFLQPAIKPIPTIPSPTTAMHVAASSTHVATSATCHVVHPNYPIPHHFNACRNLFPHSPGPARPSLPPVVPSHNSPTCSKDWVITTPFSTCETVKTQ